MSTHADNRPPVPPDPFCIEPHDPLALSIIRVWIIAAKSIGVNHSKLIKAETRFEEIKAYQKKYGTKLPD